MAILISRSNIGNKTDGDFGVRVVHHCLIYFKHAQTLTSSSSSFKVVTLSATKCSRMANEHNILELWRLKNDDDKHQDEIIFLLSWF